eukprot:5576222-Prymnesium_polylepis.1
MLYYKEMPPRVRAAVGGATLARATRPLCGHADRHDWRDELDLGRAVRNAALVGTALRGGMMQGGGEVQGGPSGTTTPACGARGGRPLFPAFA